MIGIIDYKAGNSHSVFNACNRLGIESKLISAPEELEKVSHIILPGVGSAQATMDSLEELHMIEPLTKAVMEQKKLFLGICVGLQIIFEHSEEGDADCLGWLKGKVRRFDQTKVRVPQIGWNQLEWKKENPFIAGMTNDRYFYFVNSYFAVPEEKEDILATANYGEDFVAMIAHENIYASQCHIEKSGETGLKILKNFAMMKGETLC